uniref:Bacterial type II secretion system protein E domain-containing protein n=1 Tax=Thermorudis peleae TaxID=1382356 RepID=A0A831TFL5_9BACT
MDRNLVTASLLGVLSQRLLRAVCARCAEPYQPDPHVLRELFGAPPAGYRWRRGRGCAHCHGTGYRGRIPAGELWEPSERDRLLIAKGAPLAALAASARASTLSAAEDLEDKLRLGLTTPEEVVRTLVGSLGLISAVPLTTGFASWLAVRTAPEHLPHDHHGHHHH